MLHFFYLAAFCWMCLEGIQLFRMVVLVFNTNFKTSYMMAGGYGVPAAIVAVTALINRDGYGTKKYCWLNLDSIWSFYGPACVIITVIPPFYLCAFVASCRAFTITAVAQLCVLGIMWIFGYFQFEKETKAMSYLFTFFGRLQGVMLFVMHCLFSKQVSHDFWIKAQSRCQFHFKFKSNFWLDKNNIKSNSIEV
uniref:Si:ch211-241f5.3 n=1 Tax=Xiphophorus maculatus TaxID=8083 RepID=A0A3B5QPR8_XIPMA